MNVYFNELSASNCITTEKAAMSAIETFAENCIRLKEVTKFSLMSSLSFRDLYLSNRPFISYLSNFKKEKKSIFLKLITSFPIIKEFPPYYFYESKECIGLGCAYESNSLSISLPINLRWDSPLISITMIDDSSGEIEESVNVKHIFSFEHINFHKPWIESNINDEIQKKLEKISKGQELWERREELFPHFILCNNVESGLKKFKSSDFTFKDICDKLLSLDCCFKRNAIITKEKIFHEVCGRPREESENRLKQIGLNLDILCPDDQHRTFSFHIEFHIGKTSSTSGGRIYFFPDYASKRCFIGYIGEHL